MRRALLGAIGALFVAAPAQAETIQVTTTGDGTTCDTTCTLKGAWLRALNNGAGEDDVIRVPAGTFSVAGGLDTSSGQFPTRITVTGAGANATVIQPPAGAAARVLTIGGTQIAFSDLTVRNGNAATANGGNVLVQAGATLRLTRVRVTGGQATNGGGIAVAGGANAGHVDIAQSLIDGNNATGTNNSGLGGGLYLGGSTTQAQATLTDSTVTANQGFNGADIEADTNASLQLAGVTVARNAARGPVGGIRTSNTAVTVQGSIFAANTGQAAAAPVTVAANCSFSAPATDRGGNVDSEHGCGFAGHNDTDPQLQLLDTSQQPPVLPILATSPARDIADCGGRTVDQRGVPRPQGPQCDAGAYEYDPPPDTAIGGGAPPYTFTATDAGSSFECALDGGAFRPCSSPYTPSAAPGTHTLAVRAVDPEGNADPSPATVSFTVAAPPTPTPTPTPIASPTPVPNRVVVVRKTDGTVKVKRPGKRSFEDLDASAGIPVGSEVDTRKGAIVLTAIPKPGAAPQSARFFDGLFKVTQATGITNLTLTEALAPCPRRGASAAAKKPKTRRLWGDGKGSFRTTGRYSAATIRGTKWLVQDSCTGTLTKVTQGAVSVRDNVRRRTVVVRAGKSYLAKPRR